MKRTKFLVTFLGLLSLNSFAQKAEVPNYSYDALKPDSIQFEVQTKVAKFLSDYHFKKFVIDDSLSTKVFDNYLENIDGSKLYFTKKEVENFEKYRYTLDEAMLEGNLDAAFEIFNLFRTKYQKRSEYIKNFLSKPIDYSTDKTIVLDREKATWAKTEEELDKEWDKIVLNQALNLKLSGSTDSAIVATLNNRFNVMEKRTSAYKSENVFNFFMNAFTDYLDPHTSYMIPVAAEQFNISMSQSIEGIGASLGNEGDYVAIKSIVPGGPLFKSGGGNVDDYIVAVAQGEDGEFQDIIGWLTDDAIKLIRGKKGSVVRLKLLASTAPVGTTPRELKLVRDKINLEEAVAKGSVVDVKSDKKTYKIGVVDIPLFYRDFEYARKGGDFQSTAADVKKILEDFKQKNVDGVLVDLRNNGGGSLIEAIDLTGLFIKNGPVVQRKSSIGRGSIESDEDKNIYFSGPLLVLQNRFSASASEIFAGAIQDYGRGLIVGENSFGKGTVQQLVDLDNYFVRAGGRRTSPTAGIGKVNEDQFGSLKFTSEKFYRITGNSTQIKGVVPDIELLSPFGFDEIGESVYKTALPFDQVAATSFQPVGAISNDLIKKLKEKNQKRISNEKDWKEFRIDIEEYKKQKDRKEFSLNYEVRKKEKEDADNRKGIKKMNKSIKEEDKENDIYLVEAEKILADLIALKK